MIDEVLPTTTREYAPLTYIWEDTEDHILPHALNGTQEDVGDQGFAISTCH